MKVKLSTKIAVKNICFFQSTFIMLERIKSQVTSLYAHERFSGLS